jgi:cation transport ATPase
MGLALIGGSVLLVDLQLLGFGKGRQPLARVGRDAERWMLISLALLLPTGLLQFMCFAATKYYYFTTFWTKMAALLLALIFTFSIRRRVVLEGTANATSPARHKTVAIVSLALWGTVAIAGRLIGFP